MVSFGNSCIFTSIKSTVLKDNQLLPTEYQKRKKKESVVETTVFMALSNRIHPHGIELSVEWLREGYREKRRDERGRENER